MSVPGFARQPFCLSYIFCWDESQVRVSWHISVWGRVEGKALKSSGLGKIFRWFVQSILSDVQSAQCRGSRSSLLSAPLLIFDPPVA